MVFNRVYPVDGRFEQRVWVGSAIVWLGDRSRIEIGRVVEGSLLRVRKRCASCSTLKMPLVSNARDGRDAGVYQ
jgi:hypothetical protein